MKKNVDLTANNFLNAMNSLLNKYAPFKKIIKYKLKFKAIKGQGIHEWTK